MKYVFGDDLGDFAFAVVGVSRSEGNPDRNPKMVSDTAKLFCNAKDNIWFVCEQLPHPIYSSASVVDALNHALGRSCTVEAIVGPQADDDIIRDWASRGISVYSLDEHPRRRFAVVDGKH